MTPIQGKLRKDIELLLEQHGTKSSRKRIEAGEVFK